MKKMYIIIAIVVVVLLVGCFCKWHCQKATTTIDNPIVSTVTTTATSESKVKDISRPLKKEVAPIKKVKK